MPICSLLPAATEIAFALGLGDEIVGVTHECDYPPQAKEKPVVVRSAIDPARMTSAEIDARVGNTLRLGKSLYMIDREALLQAAPDLILTQGLCDVCALDYNEVLRAAESLPRPPAVLSLNPRRLQDVLRDILRVGEATGRRQQAEALVQDLQRRIDGVAAARWSRRPRVVCLEWFDPLYFAGHWVPEMVEIAGGIDALGHKGESSAKLTWPQVTQASPEIIVLMPCGFDLKRTIAESAVLKTLDAWKELPAVKAGDVYAVNGHAYFSRPGPRLIDGLEILARIIHPEIFPSAVSSEAAERVSIEVC
jgi:iron complex transport system substrate-binding protein